MEKHKIIKLANVEDITPFNSGEFNQYYQKWIDFGKDNDYPSYLRSLYLSSPTHQTICDQVTNLATGEGVEVVNPEQNPISNKFLNENFPKETIKHLLSDLKIYGYCAIQVYQGSKCLYSPAIKYRFDKKDENGIINYVWYSENWDNYNYKDNKPVKLPVYTEGSDDELSILIIQLDKKSFDYYSPVDYSGAINYINLECEISKFHLNNIRNGLFPSFVITFIGNDFTDESMQQIESQINKKFGGTQNTGRAIVGFAPSKDEATVIDTITQSDLPEQYQFLATECSNKILVGHGITSPLLVGIRNEGGGLGSNVDEIQNAFLLYFEAKLKGYQNYILEGITKIMNGNLLFAEIQFKTYNPFIKSTTLSKINLENEIDMQELVAQLDVYAEKPKGTLINTKIFNGKLQDGCLYKFVKSSKRNNMLIKKFEMLDKKGYMFKKCDLIKNTADYYFVEHIFYKNNEE